MSISEKKPIREKSNLLSEINIEQIILEKPPAGDAPLLEAVYFSTRSEEFAALGWPDEALAAFLKTQFEFQKSSYALQFPGAENSIIKCGEKPAGRLIVDRSEKEIRLVDIALLPEFRNLGIGGKIISNLIEEARSEKKTLTLQVLKSNEAAFRLYLRMGFGVTREDEIYVSMEYSFY